MLRTPHEKALLVSAYRRCEAAGTPREFWSLLKVATKLARLDSELTSSASAGVPGNAASVPGDQPTRSA